jgi:hypothetical protein
MFFSEETLGVDREAVEGLRPLLSDEDLRRQQEAYDAAREEAASSIHQAYAEASAKINSLTFTRD